MMAVARTAQVEYPEKPVAFVVPWPPGDLEDVLTRMIAEDFSDTYGVPTAVANKSGGGGGPFSGVIEVANALADGDTVGSFIIAIPVVGPQIGIPDLNPYPFAPFGNFLTYPFVIAAGGDAPYDDMAGLAAHAAENDVVLGHFGAPLVPTQVTLCLPRCIRRAGLQHAGVGSCGCINTTLQQILPCLDDVKVLASVGSERISITPDAPTVAEIAPNLDVALWNGLFVHKNIPQDVRDNGTEVGMALKAEPGSAAATIRYYAEAPDKIYGEIAPTAEGILGMIHKGPAGVVGAITPWNFPMMVGAWKLGPVLAMGDSVVLKHSETASLSLLRMAALALEARLPPGELNAVTGEGAVVGEAMGLLMQVDVLAFTGSGGTGRRLMDCAARSNMKRVYLELGGKSPNIVFADAPDLSETARVAAVGIFRNSGQVCVAGSRPLIEASIHDNFSPT